MAFDFNPPLWNRLPYAVLDQNSMRDQAIVSAAVANAKNGRLILLHDIAFVEMTKSPQWADTMRKSLQLLAAYPQGVVAGYTMVAKSG